VDSDRRFDPFARDYGETDRNRAWRKPWESPTYEIGAFYAAIMASLHHITEADETTRRSQYTEDSVADYKRALTRFVESAQGRA
jgi:hypothetical protein